LRVRICRSLITEPQEDRAMLTRRQTLAAAAAAASAAVLSSPSSPRPLLAADAPAAGPAGAQAPGFYRYKVGDIELTAINDGFMPRPVDALVKNVDAAEVKRALGEAFLPQDTLPISFTTLALRTGGGKLVLIDTGLGDMGAPTTGVWRRNFTAAGFDPKDVATVIISHFHPDHINGLRLKDGTAVFPNAEVMVPAAEWAHWTDDAKMSAAPEAAKANFQNVRRVFGPMAKDVKQYEGGKELVPGVTAMAAPGHTPGHTAYAVTSGQGRLLVMSDTSNHPALFVRHPGWHFAFDMDARQAEATRRKLLETAADERMQVSFYHAPFPATGHIAREGDGFRLVPAEWRATL
jgi:glyoxylase-like metal-dependent hydrolase (beta-lactamase superfamily II)